MMVGSLHCELQSKDIENNVNCQWRPFDVMCVYEEENYRMVFTDCKKGILHISRRLFLDNLFNVLVGESNKLLEHCKK